jgi:hypothetical protein
VCVCTEVVGVVVCVVCGVWCVRDGSNARVSGSGEGRLIFLDSKKEGGGGWESGTASAWGSESQQESAAEARAYPKKQQKKESRKKESTREDDGGEPGQGHGAAGQSLPLPLSEGRKEHVRRSKQRAQQVEAAADRQGRNTFRRLTAKAVCAFEETGGGINRVGERAGEEGAITEAFSAGIRWAWEVYAYVCVWVRESVCACVRVNICVLVV